MTSSGIEPATFWLVAQRLNYYKGYFQLIDTVSFGFENSGLIDNIKINNNDCYYLETPLSGMFGRLS
jgi:hypothetical protein